MRPFTQLALHVSLISLLKLSNAQSNPYNLLTVPGCSTVYNIVNSCAQKLGVAATNTASAFSCICYDNSGNYVPSSYDNAASSCTSYELTAFSTQGNSFLAYVAGFCTNTLYAPPGTAAVTTTSVAGGAGGSPVTRSTTPESTSTPGTNPGGPIISVSSNSSASITQAPTTTGATGASGAVTTTSSKAEGFKVGYVDKNGFLWSVFSPLLAAILAV